MTVIELSLSQSAFDELHSIADTQRTLVKVSRVDLSNLLRDYSALLRSARAAGVNTLEPARFNRPRLNTKAADEF